MAPRHTALKDNIGRVEIGDLLQGNTHLADCDTVAPVWFERTDEECIERVRDGEDGREETGRFSEVCLEGRVVGGRRAPRISASDEVEEDDTERPDVVGPRGVAAGSCKGAAVAFCEKGA